MIDELDGDALVTDAGDRVQVKRADDVQRERKRRTRALMNQQLSSPDGRQVIWEMLATCGVFDDVEGPADLVARWLGRRRVGLDLLQRLDRWHHRDYLLMQTEARARAVQEAEENKAARTSAATAATDPD